jgi:hypothetical protein
MLEERTIEAQQILDELFSKKLIPFELSVGKFTEETDGYTIHFHDSRIYTAHIPRIEGQSFKETCRSAILHRVAQMSGPLANSASKDST